MSWSGDKAPAPRRQRRHQRHSVDERLLVSYELEGRSTSVHGRCTSLSLGGFGAVLAGDLAPGDVVSVEFRFRRAAEPLRLRAHVRHRRGFQHGFEFLGLSTAQTRSLRQLIADLTRLPKK